MSDEENTNEGMLVSPPDDDRKMVNPRDVMVPLENIRGFKEFKATRDQTRHDTVTLVCGVHLTTIDGHQDSAEIRTSSKTETKEQVYKRRTTLPVGKRPFDSGWVEVPGYVVLENLSKPPEGAEASVLEDWNSKPPTIIFNGFVVGPGDAIVGKLAKTAAASIEVLNKPVAISLSVFPR